MCCDVVYLHPPATRAVTESKRNNLMDFGRYVQEMMPKYVQLTQITYRCVLYLCQFQISYIAHELCVVQCHLTLEPINVHVHVCQRHYYWFAPGSGVH